MSLLAPSYAGVSGLGGNADSIQVDGGTTEGIFEWDLSFVAYMFGLDSLELALSNLIAVVKSKTVAGFVPGLSSGTSKTRSETQPPVTAKALYEITKRWGPNRTRWAVELCFDDLYNWNTWMYTQRRETPLGLLTCGESPYASYAPDGTAGASKPGGGHGCSGLDNGPTVDGVPFNQTGLDLQDQYDAGFTGMYLMDSRVHHLCLLIFTGMYLMDTTCVSYLMYLMDSRVHHLCLLIFALHTLIFCVVR